jgi:hypothetical protein
VAFSISFLGASAFSQTLPLELRQAATLYNVVSVRGAPISNTTNDPPGSDGRAPGPGSGSVGTSNQFQHLLSFVGGVGSGTNASRLNPTLSYAANAANLDLPRGTYGPSQVILLRARIGNALGARPVSFLFGDIITPPEKDEYGVDLVLTNSAVNPARFPALPGDYWLAEPYSATGHTNAGYYWSPHAEQVYASESGPVSVVWRKAAPSSPAGPLQDVATVTVAGVTYTVYTNRYIVSTAPIKPPRRIYWTEGKFSQEAKAVKIPTGRVKDVRVVYNSRFPGITNEVRFEGKLAGPIEITNTFWFDTTLSILRAYNVEGRLLLELLGDKRGQIGAVDIHQSLGIELVDVIQRPVAADVTTELGELLTPFQGAAPAGTPPLFPDPVLAEGDAFAYRHSIPGTALFEYFAIRETANQTDYQVHWMEEGLEGLLWPNRFVRYQMIWPVEVAHYSHYLRPAVATEEEARATAVALPSANAPSIVYQDPLDRPRGKLTENFAYYTFLDTNFPAHRGLLQFTAGESVRFERVFSWLDQSLRQLDSTGVGFAGTVATNLSAWSAPGTLTWPDEFTRPRLVRSTVSVGDRLTAPPGELGGDPAASYLAGYVQASQGDSYHPDAYLDPFSRGFDLASQGAIIPVNARPGNNLLEVWWFRKNQVNTARGFQSSFWPAAIGRYTIQWPVGGSEILLASNDGSGPLNSLEAKGTIYFQNDPTQPGYNPNEEHALMQGGQAYALRDDLNILTSTNGEYSSAPFVLLQYTAPDGRVAIHPFQVRREKPQAGITFEFTRTAGSILQPPMPLPLLGVAFAPRIPGQPVSGLNEEIVSWTVASSARNAVTPAAWTLTTAFNTEGAHGFLPFWALAVQNFSQTPARLFWLYGTNVTERTVSGVISANRPFPVGSLGAGATQTLSPNRWRFNNAGATFPLSSAALLAAPATRQNWLVTITASQTNYVEVDFGGARPAAATNASATVLVVAASGLVDGAFNGWRLAWNETPQSTSDPDRLKLYASATVTDRKGNVWIYRGPHTNSRPEAFTMHFYYNTLPGFYFPTLAPNAQPPAGTATPYLRALGANGQFVGDAVFANPNLAVTSVHNALAINYHPVWPDNVPVLQMGETLTTPRRGLPAVRGQSSLQVLYQQSQIGVNASSQLIIQPNTASVVLQDPTREKTVAFDQALLPASVKTEISRGKTFFPALPPHLVKRFYLDPDRATAGALVFAGEFVDAPLGDKYVLLNVAGPQDLATLRSLCLASDPGKSRWDNAVANLSTSLEKFVENPAQPGSFIAQQPATRVARAGDVAAVTDDDVAVDSYALTAVGPSSGYVTLLAGNGLAFTPPDEPVSVHVLRVVPQLYRGQVNVIESENPLNEKLTLQQVVDLAGQAQDYTFEWRITAPVDGQPPATYDKVPLLFNPNPWSHLRFVQGGDAGANFESIPPARIVQDVSDTVTPVSAIAFLGVTQEINQLRFTLDNAERSPLALGDQLVAASADGTEMFVTVHDLPTNQNQVVVSVDPGQPNQLSAASVFRLSERIVPGRPQSILFTRFHAPPGQSLTEFWLGVDFAAGITGRILINGGEVARLGLGGDDTESQSPPANLASPHLSRYFRLPPSYLSDAPPGADGLVENRVAVEIFSSAAPNAAVPLALRLEGFRAVDRVAGAGSVWLPLDPAQYQDGVRAIVGDTADVRSLSDNYLTMRYALKVASADTNRWSQWTEPQLAEGWIKRVLNGINPFNQRVADLLNNAVNTDVSLLTQAGARWEGDVALNLDTINSFGLIEIYETVLNRGRTLSVDGGINYGPANDALLLAAGYLNDLYTMLGNEAAADAANPTIGIGTKDNTYGDIATALFSFRGQLPSLLEEELALLRGRDDFLVPGVELRPVYNRLVWNYTRGIDAGEVVYALNYNILDQNVDGRVDANDARLLFPQGHGDAYGHYLTAMKGYYRLLLNRNFDWVPRSEAVLILGQPVSVDYQDERKFAAAAGAVARSGKQIFDLTWRRDYQSGPGAGWKHLGTTRSSNQRTRFWGADHWAARTGQGAYLNWVVGNAIVPAVDPDPAHLDTIQQVDRTTVPELKELPAVVESLQAAVDNANAGVTPLGLPEGTIPFDLNPLSVANGQNTSHFEQIYQRAVEALNNATAAFDDSKDVTRLMRSEQDSLAEFRTSVQEQELAYTNALIEIYGTPYPEDIGPGKTYRSGFVGPDNVHYMYVDNVELNFAGPQGSLLNPQADVVWRIDTQTFTANWLDGTNGVSDFNFIQPARNNPFDGTGLVPSYQSNRTLYVEYTLSSHGFFKKPASWTGKRSSPGRVQQAISDIIKARNAAYSAFYETDAAKGDLDWAIQQLRWKTDSHANIVSLQRQLLVAESVFKSAQAAWEISDKILETTEESVVGVLRSIELSIPENFIAGVAAGGSVGSPAKGAVKAGEEATAGTIDWIRVAGFSVVRALEAATEISRNAVEFDQIAPEEWNQELRGATSEVRDKVYGMQNRFTTINERLQELDEALRAYRATLAEAGRIQQEREVFRQRTAAVIQGFRSRDAAFRIFRNEKLERYKTMFDLAAQYAFMAAKAYDYETGLLDTSAGREFVNRIIRSRALGVMRDGQPQFAGSDTGDPGLSSAMAEMNADWAVLKGRLGIKNPDAYGTTTSLRTENFRFMADTNGDVNWRTMLNQARKANLLDDPDVRRYCLQIDPGNGLPVPGLIVEFSTTIADGLNIFGRPLAPGDHYFSPSSFATKIFGMGVSLEGYIGMDNPTANGSAVDSSGAATPADPTSRSSIRWPWPPRLTSISSRSASTRCAARRWATKAPSEPGRSRMSPCRCRSTSALRVNRPRPCGNRPVP